MDDADAIRAGGTADPSGLILSHRSGIICILRAGRGY